MSSEQGGFTVKEMLTQIVIPDLKAIKASIDNKADRSEVVALEARLAHFEAAEASYVKRTGPIMDDFRRQASRVDELEKESIKRGAIVDRYLNTERLVQANSEKLSKLPAEVRAQIDEALKKYDKQMEQESEARFSRRDRILLAVLAIIGAIATIISTVYLVIATGGPNG